MSTLSHYVAARFLRAFAASLFVLTLAVLVVDLLLDLGDILEKQQDLAGIATLVLMRIAALYLPYLIPVAAFTAAFFSIGVAARNLEVLAMKAGGVSPLRAVLPVFLCAAALSAGALVLDETVTVRASAALHRRDFGDDEGSLSLRSGTIWYHTGRFIYNIAGSDSASDTLRKVHIFERDARGRLIRRIEAESARRIAPNRWTFRNVTVRRFDPAARAAAPTLERAAETTLELAEERSPRLVEKEIESLPLWSLALFVARGEAGPRASAILHQRLTSPLLVLLFALLAVPLGLGVERTGTLAFPALQGVFLLFVFLMAREYAASLAAREGAIQAVWTPWLTLGVFGVYGAWRLVRVPR